MLLYFTAAGTVYFFTDAVTKQGSHHGIIDHITQIVRSFLLCAKWDGGRDTIGGPGPGALIAGACRSSPAQW